MQKRPIQGAEFATYLALIKNSVGSKTFQNYYVQQGGKRVDVMHKGDLSCAFFVSSVLVLCKLANRVHGTVTSTVKDLEKIGWKKIKTPKPGSVIVWEVKQDERGEPHGHIGFYMGNNMAISNSAKKKVPAKHHYTYSGKRKVEAIYWNSHF